MPEVITYVLTPENIDTPDANVGDGAPLDANGRVSLRSVFQEVAASGNLVDTYQIIINAPGIAGGPPNGGPVKVTTRGGTSPTALRPA